MMKYNNIQVVILAGGFLFIQINILRSGQLLFPLCERFPKCLLPIANKPMISYQLELLEQYGLYDIIVVTSKLHGKIESYIYQEKSKLKVEIVTIHEEDNERRDSAEALLKIKDRIRGDFIVMSCDSITDANLHDLLDFHYLKNSSLTVLMKKEDLETGKKLGKAPVSCNLNDNYDICLVNPITSELAHILNSDDVDEFGDFSVKRNVLMKHSNLELMSNLFDAHIYICKPIVLRLIEELSKNKNIATSNFKEDFLSNIIRYQNNDQIIQLVENITKENASQSNPLNQLFQNREEQNNRFQVYAYIDNKLYCRRINNLKDYMQVHWDSMIKGDKTPKCFIMNEKGSQTPVNQNKNYQGDSLVEKETNIKENVKIQRSFIGRNCIIEENVKISNSIIMRDCVINAGCTIQNSIISNNTYVQSYASLERCFTGPNVVIDTNTKNVEETFVFYEKSGSFYDKTGKND